MEKAIHASGTTAMTSLFVNGTLMRGLPLHRNISTAIFVSEAFTGPYYRLHSIRDVHPGMYGVESCGARIAGELYLVTAAQREHIVRTEPPGLYLGLVVLEDGRTVEGVLYPEDLARAERDITGYGGWRAYLVAMKPVVMSERSA